MVDTLDPQANHLLARALEGKLFLMCGIVCDNVHANATLLLIDERIRHNKNVGVESRCSEVRRTWFTAEIAEHAERSMSTRTIQGASRFIFRLNASAFSA